MKYTYILILLVTLFGCKEKNALTTGLEGKPLPSIKFLLTDSVTYVDTKDLPPGKATALFYFGPNCPYSKAQMEEILNNISILKNINFYVFTTWPFSEMKEFSTHYNLQKYSNIKTGMDYSDFFPIYFKTQGVPYIAIYGKDKRLNRAFLGLVNSKQIKDISEQ